MSAHALPATTEKLLKQFDRRLAAGLFLDVWPRWAIGSLLTAGGVVLACRLFFPDADAHLHLLWLAPVVAGIPALAVCRRRAYRRADLLALADSLGGGHGTLLSFVETGDASWVDSPSLMPAFILPRFQAWRRVRLVIPAAVFLAVTLALPQRVLTVAPNGAVARAIVKDLETTLATLKKQELLTPAEEKKLEEEIERIRQGAMSRVDPGAWEAADALREKMAAGLSEKRDALKWAEESLLRFADASRGGGTPTEAEIDELEKALQKLAENGMLEGLSAELQKLLGDKTGQGKAGQGKAGQGEFNLPKDAAQRAELAQALSEALGQRGERFGELSKLGREFGRFDAGDFPLSSDGLDGDQGGDSDSEEPGNGGVSRGRGDAAMTWGNETDPADRFRAQALPPGMARNPDDWTPVANLKGAPKADPQSSSPAAARDYASGAGQAAWRRTLAPRHYSAVKNYFEK